MSDQPAASNPAAPNQEQRHIGIQRIYLKDVSLETPNSPGIFQTDGTPDNNLNLNTGISQLAENVYEVVLSVTLTTKVGDKTAYLVEVQQAGIFLIQGFSDQERGPLLGAYCPNMLFPYAREAITDLVAKASFPQVVLQPINFDQLFVQHQQELAKRAQEQGGGNGSA
jgi:preprotein translocase subunit SecB